MHTFRSIDDINPLVGTYTRLSCGYPRKTGKYDDASNCWIRGLSGMERDVILVSTAALQAEFFRENMNTFLSAYISRVPSQYALDAFLGLRTGIEIGIAGYLCGHEGFSTMVGTACNAYAYCAALFRQQGPLCQRRPWTAIKILFCDSLLATRPLIVSSCPCASCGEPQRLGDNEPLS